jgi:hypothetical protein
MTISLKHKLSTKPRDDRSSIDDLKTNRRQKREDGNIRTIKLEQILTTTTTRGHNVISANLEKHGIALATLGTW